MEKINKQPIFKNPFIWVVILIALTWFVFAFARTCGLSATSAIGPFKVEIETSQTESNSSDSPLGISKQIEFGNEVIYLQPLPGIPNKREPAAEPTNNCSTEGMNPHRIRIDIFTMSGKGRNLIETFPCLSTDPVSLDYRGYRIEINVLDIIVGEPPTSATIEVAIVRKPLLPWLRFLCP